MNTFLFMYTNSRDVIICYLELRKTRSVFPIPLEFEISKFACMLFFIQNILMFNLGVAFLKSVSIHKHGICCETEHNFYLLPR